MNKTNSTINYSSSYLVQARSIVGPYTFYPIFRDKGPYGPYGPLDFQDQNKRSSERCGRPDFCVDFNFHFFGGLEKRENMWTKRTLRTFSSKNWKKSSGPNVDQDVDLTDLMWTKR